MHPVIQYFAEEWDRAESEERPPDLSSLKVSDIIKMCKSGAALHPSWSSLLHFQTLPLLLKKQPEAVKWWLLGLDDGDNDIGEYIPHVVYLSCTD
jgi:hypothetical protein